MKKVNLFLFAVFCFLSMANQAMASFHDSMVGKWFFHQRAVESSTPQERWILTAVEFFPDGRCSILNQPSSDLCVWTQDATVMEAKVFGDNGLLKMTWRGAMSNKNLLEGNGSAADGAAYRMYLIRNQSAAPAAAPLEVRSSLGFWGLQYKKPKDAWVSYKIYFSHIGRCQIDAPFESCEWSQNLKEFQVSLKLSKNEAPILFYVSPLNTKPGFQGKIVDSFTSKKELGCFYLNSK